MRVTIDREECTSCAACWDDYPEIFEESEEDGTAQIVAKLRSSDDLDEGKVPDDLGEAARSAAEACPAEIIYVEE